MAARSLRDRNHYSILVVCAQGSTSGQIRQALKSIGFQNMSTASSHIQALEKVKVRNFSHIVMDAKTSDMPSLDFVKKILEMDPKSIMIALSEQPRIDDVFGLLREGARGFIVPPFTTELIENVFNQATDGPALSEAVLNAPDRNGAFTAIILNNLYRLSVAMRQAKEFTTAARDVKNYNYALREAVDLAQLFCEGGDEDLKEKIIEGCINRAKDAATRLGRLRKKLKKERVDDDDPVEASDGAEGPKAEA